MDDDDMCEWMLGSGHGSSERGWHEEVRSPEEEERAAALALAYRRRVEERPIATLALPGSPVAEILAAWNSTFETSQSPTGNCLLAGNVTMVEVADARADFPEHDGEWTWFGASEKGCYTVRVQLGPSVEIYIDAGVTPSPETGWPDYGKELFVFWCSQSDQMNYFVAAYDRYEGVMAGKPGYEGLEPLSAKTIAMRREVAEAHLELAFRAVADRDDAAVAFRWDPRTGWWYDGDRPYVEPGGCRVMAWE